MPVPFYYLHSVSVAHLSCFANSFPVDKAMFSVLIFAEDATMRPRTRITVIYFMLKSQQFANLYSLRRNSSSYTNNKYFDNKYGPIHFHILRTRPNLCRYAFHSSMGQDISDVLRF